MAAIEIVELVFGGGLVLLALRFASRLPGLATFGLFLLGVTFALPPLVNDWSEKDLINFGRATDIRRVNYLAKMGSIGLLAIGLVAARPRTSSGRAGGTSPLTAATGNVGVPRVADNAYARAVIARDELYERIAKSCQVWKLPFVGLK